VGGPPAVAWVETGLVLAQLDGDSKSDGDGGGDSARDRYRAYVEAGTDEKQVSPFERAVAGLALGGEAYLRRICALVQGRKATEDEPALANLRRAGRASPEQVEAAVEDVFDNERPARKRRILLYAQRLHSSLRPADVARRYGRTRGAVTLAKRDLDDEATRNPELASRLDLLAKRLDADKF
jgi:hypothetical protein